MSISDQCKAVATVVDSESDDDEESSHSGSKAGFPNRQSKESSKQKFSKPSRTSKALKLNAADSQKVSEPKRMGAKCSSFKEDSRSSLLSFGSTR